MRIWNRLIIWVDVEAKSAEAYLRLANAASQYENKKIVLWTGPELQLALNWKKQYNPNAEWAQRYNNAFFEVI